MSIKFILYNHPFFNLKSSKLILFVVAVLCFTAVELYAQNASISIGNKVDTVTQDTIRTSIINDLKSDTMKTTRSDSISLGKSLSKEKNSLKTTVKYSADTVRIDIAKKIIYLHGNANVEYGDLKLTAADIIMNQGTNILLASARVDSTRRKVGKPIFKDTSGEYETDSLKYNFKTTKAIVYGAVTQEDEGYVRGAWLKKDENGDVYIRDGRYTTCNLEDPHYHIGSKKIKRTKNGTIITGPFNLHVKDIPTPLGFAFGIFPPPKEKASGLVIPQWGEEQRRGFFLRNGGYYWAINDYVDLTLLGEIYTKGSRGLRVSSNYKKRYGISGNVELHYNRQRTINDELDTVIANDYSIQWSHRPANRGKGRFSANVNARTSSYNNNNATDYLNQINPTYRSDVSYSTNFWKVFNFTANANLNQNIRTKVATITLPSFNLNTNRINPFKNFGNPGSKSPLKALNFNYTFSGKNQISNIINNPSASFPLVKEGTPDTLEIFYRFFTLLKNSQNGFKHTIPVSTTINLFKFFTINPSFNYEELWYLKEIDFNYDEAAKAVRADTISKFSRAFKYSANASVNTRLYGTYIFKKGSAIQAVRHMLTPSVSFSYSPDLSAPRYGYFKEIQVDSTGTMRKVSKYEGFIFGTPNASENFIATFSLNNTLEMKYKSKKDTSNQAKKIPIFKNIGLNTSYNFLADSFKLSNISMSANTSLFESRLNVNLTASLDPYVYWLDSVQYDNQGNVSRVYQRKVDLYRWNAGKGVGQLSSIVFTTSTSLNPKARKRQNEREEELRFDPRYDPTQYVDFDIPWNLNVNYSLNYSKRGFEEKKITQTLSFNGDVSLTKKWKIGFNSGYDFEAKKLTNTKINVYRDLHCWELVFDWTPFGRYTSYSVDLRVKASILRDLKLTRRRNFLDN